MTRQVTVPRQPTSPALESWIRFLRAHAQLTREMSARLQAQHGLTLNDFDVLVQLSAAPGRQMRRVDLAQSVLLTASGITRLLDGLERAGWVCRGTCESDARVSYAVLTDAGLDKLREARATHLADIDALFSSRFSKQELDQLGSLLGRLAEPSNGDAAACGAD